MQWNPKDIWNDFLSESLYISPRPVSTYIDVQPMPHRPPTKLPEGRMAVYVFSSKDHVLKVGRVGPNSQGRYTYQHYNVNSTPSTLAKSLINDAFFLRQYRLNKENIGDWIKNNTDRVNFLLHASIGLPFLKSLELFLQQRLQPVFG